MSTLARNQLVWLSDDGWRGLAGRAWDTQAAEILGHWHARRLPLVVCRQHEGVAPGRVALGLPAPTRWGRRRLALDVAQDALQTSGAFPTLLQVARKQPWGPAARPLWQALSSIGAVTRVYGSHGWQHLSGEAYLHEASDLDLSIELPDAAAARAAVASLQQARLHRRVDGELVFPGGDAVAWREFARALQQPGGRVLVKRLRQVQLVEWPAWHGAAA
jgi:phosphoribosyl-dephospho-CoA transferase